MAPPSLTKRDLFRALRVKVGWGALLFPFLYDFSSHCLLVSNLTSTRPRYGTTTRISNTRPYGFWLMLLSRSHPHEDKSVSYFHCVKRGILGIGTVHGFGPDWVDGRNIAWLEWVHKGVLNGSPWENRLNFKAVAHGSQHMLSQQRFIQKIL